MTTIDCIKTEELSPARAELISLCLENKDLARFLMNVLKASEDEQRHILNLTDPDALMDVWNRYTA